MYNKKKLSEDVKAVIADAVEYGGKAEPEAKIGLNVGLQNWRNYVLNDNEDVGSVTLMFQIFHDLRNKAILAKVQEDYARHSMGEIRKGHLLKMKELLNDSREVFKIVFSNQGDKGMKMYSSPLGASEEDVMGETYVPYRKVSLEQVKEVFRRARYVFFCPDNVAKVCADMIDVARFYQELTIDATKSGEKIEIPCIEGLKMIKTVSRKVYEAAAQIKIDWVAGTKSMPQPIKGGYHTMIFGEEVVKQYWITDDASKAMASILKHVDAAATVLTQVKQALPEGMVEEANAAAKEYADIAGVFNFVRDLSMDLQSAKSRTINAFNARFNGKNRQAEKKREDFRRAVTDEYNLVYPAIGSMLREAAEDLELDLEQEIVGMIALWAAMQKKAQGKKSNDMEVSAFASHNLTEEFFLYIMDFFANEIDIRTEDPVMVGDEIEDGEVIELGFGSYVDLDNEDRWIKSVKDLNGSFIIAQKDGRWVAKKKFLNLIDIPEPTNELIFTTKMNPRTMKNAKETFEGMRGKTIYLVPYLSGTDCHDAIVVDGVIVGEFKCSVGKHSDKGAVKKENSATNKLLTKLYRKKGIVKFFDFKAAGDSGLQAVVCLENVEEYDDSEVVVSKSLIVEKPTKEDKAPRKRPGFKTRVVGKAFLGDDVKTAPKKTVKAEKPKSKKKEAKEVNGYNDTVIYGRVIIKAKEEFDLSVAETVKYINLYLAEGGEVDYNKILSYVHRSMADEEA